MKKLLLTLLLFCFAAAKAQYKNPFFNTLTVEKGLPEGNVIFSLEDKLGYIWLGTQNGLVRYDGYQLKTYTSFSTDSKQNLMRSVQYLFEDSKGTLWVSMALDGIYSYDRQKDSFNKIKIDTATSNAFEDNQIYGWVEDKQSGIFIITTYDQSEDKAQVYTYDPVHNKMQNYGPSKKGKYYIPNRGGGNLIKDGNEKIWLATDSLISMFNPKTASFDAYAVMPDTTKNLTFYGAISAPADPGIILLNTYITGNEVANKAHKGKFYQFDTKSKTFTAYTNIENDPNSIADACLHILKDSLKRIWCSTEKGISLLNTHTGKFTNYALKLPASLTDEKTHVEAITADKDGNLWLGGYFKGIFYLDVKTGVATYYAHTNAEGSLPDHNGIKQLFFDRSGMLWINMPDDGMSYLNRPRSMFNPFPIAPSLAETDGKVSMDDYFIYEKYGDSSFLVKDTSALYIWNYYKNSFKHIDLGKNKIYKQINAIYAAKDGNIWIGTGGAGLFCYSPETKEVKQYKNDLADSTSLAGNAVSAILGDAAGNIWIGTSYKGLCCLNKQTGKFIRYPFIVNNGTIKPGNKLDDRNVVSLYFDSDSILWIGTNFGSLNKLDIKTSRFTSFIGAKWGLNSVTAIYEDSHKRLWAGTYLSGLFLIDKKTGSYKRYGEQDGLLYNCIAGIKEDKAGFIWTISPRGLSRLDVEKNEFSNFVTYNSNGSFLGEGDLFNVSMKNGLLSFDPGKMTISDIAPVVLIESVGYNNAGNDRDTIIFTNGRDHFELKYNENKISFQYVAIHMADPLANRYAYMLEGSDEDWVQAGKQRSATYTNLSPGTYTFKVKAANSDGVWNDAGARFTIIILPPWWKTWWAYLLYAFTFIAAISSFIAYRSATLKKENKLLEEKVTLRTNQLQTSITELKATQTQLIQSEKMASLGELTAGIAHEIQNPLNFVNNFSEVSLELIDEIKSEKSKPKNEQDEKLEAEILNDIAQNLEKINHHGKRADGIVKGMLQHSRSSSGQKEPTNINALCDEYLRLAYHGLRAKDKLFNAAIDTNFDESIGKINIIPQDIGRVIMNLLTNAFYSVNDKNKTGIAGYRPLVKIETKKINARTSITITDNGNGIPQNIIDKVFQPFFTTKPTGQGTGLGLSLSYDIIKAHGGILEVKSKEAEFAEFIITL